MLERNWLQRDYQSRQDGNIVSMINSVNRKWLCVAGLGEISGDEAANPGWDQIRNNLICHAKEI